MPEAHLSYLPALRELVVLFGGAIAVIALSQRVRIPPVVGFLVTGLLVGPSLLGLIERSPRLDAFAEVGVLLLLFGIGLEITSHRLRELGRFLVVGGGLQVSLTTAVVGAVAWSLGVAPRAALFYGFVAALSSTAIVLKRFLERRELDAPHAKIATGVLLFQDLLIVPMLLVVPMLAGAGGVSATAVLLRLGEGLLILGVVFAAGRFLVPRALRWLAESRVRELLLLGSLFACLGGAILTEHLGFSLALGAFLAGVLIADSQFQHHVVAETGPLRDVFNSLFFISVGTLVDLAALADDILGVLGLAGGVIAVKFAVVFLTVAWLGYPVVTRVGAGLALAQIGELSFLLAHAGHGWHLIADGPYQRLLGAIVLTMIATPAMIGAHSRWAGSRNDGVGAQAEGAARDHIVVAGYGLVGRQLSTVLGSAGIAHRVVDLDPARIRAAEEAGRETVFGDASRNSILLECEVPSARACVFLVSDPAAQRRAIEAARGLAPSIPILARARRLDEIQVLLDAGADQVIVEELEASVEIVTAVLARLHVPGNVVRTEARLLRAGSYEMMRSPQRSGLTELVTKALAEGATDTFMLGAAQLGLGRTLGELDLRRRAGATVIAVVRGERSISNPSADEPLADGDVLVLMGAHAEIEEAFRFLESAEDSRRSGSDFQAASSESG